MRKISTEEKQEFVKIWNDSADIKEVSEKTGFLVEYLYKKSKALRKEGFDLQIFSDRRRPKSPNQILEDFWSRVEKGERGNDCWKWMGNKTKKRNYGLFRQTYAHRFSWVLHFGEIPEGLHVLHDCDNPPCTNPFHLFLGTNLDNILDMKSKGRQNKGEKNGSCKITEKEVRNLRRLVSRYGSSEGLIKSGVLKKIHITTARMIINRKIWAWLD